jgi:hypothetical protein
MLSTLDVTIPEMYLFLYVIVQMGHDQRQTERLLIHTRTVFIAFYSKKQWNETDNFIYLDFCISVTTEMNLTR